MPLVLSVLAWLFAGGCGTVDPEPAPPAPQMVPFSGNPLVEHGIRPDPAAPDADNSRSGAIRVEWRSMGTAELGAATLGGFNLYRSDSLDPSGRPVSFRRLAQIRTSASGADTSWSDTSAGVNVTRYYFVRAFSRATEAEGPPSDTVNYTLTIRPVPLAPIGVADSAAVSPLRLRYAPALAVGDIAVRLLRVAPENETIVLDTLWVAATQSEFGETSVTYSGGPLVSGARYRWRIDKIFGDQPTGNASRWVSFIAP